jgi:hypothetical protein
MKTPVVEGPEALRPRVLPRERLGRRRPTDGPGSGPQTCKKCVSGLGVGNEDDLPVASRP